MRKPSPSSTRAWGAAAGRALITSAEYEYEIRFYEYMIVIKGFVGKLGPSPGSPPNSIDPVGANLVFAPFTFTPSHGRSQGSPLQFVMPLAITRIATTTSFSHRGESCIRPDHIHPQPWAITRIAPTIRLAIPPSPGSPLQKHFSVGANLVFAPFAFTPSHGRSQGSPLQCNFPVGANLVFAPSDAIKGIPSLWAIIRIAPTIRLDNVIMD